MHTSRRQFIKSAAALAGAAVYPNLLFGKDRALSQLNVAAIGTAGKGRSDISEISKDNRIAFLCDVDLTRTEDALKAFPGAKVFSDYREMFAQVADQIDVVTVSTPDHMHFPIAIEAIKHGKPLMVQKPLCNNLWEARALANYAREKGVLTVMGNQGATMQGTRIIREWIEAGVIGEVTEVHYWTNRPIWPQGSGLEFPPAEVPDTLDWDVWQGTCATERPYSPEIHPFKWRGFWDYGCGALGDIGCHSFNSAFWALDLAGDFVVEATFSSPFDEVTAPERSTIVYDFPAKGKREALKVVWQDGIKDANTQKDFIRPPGVPKDMDLQSPYGCGQMFIGTEGMLYIGDPYGSSRPRLLRNGQKMDSPKIEPVYERVKGGPTQELCRAIRGEGPKAVSNFEDHAGPLTEMVLAGNLALRSRQKIDWDSANMAARGLPEIQKMTKRAYRAGWEPKLT